MEGISSNAEKNHIEVGTILNPIRITLGKVLAIKTNDMVEGEGSQLKTDVDVHDHLGIVQDGDDEDDQYGHPTHHKKLEDLTIAELRLLKSDIEESYGKVMFENHIFKKIVNFLNNEEQAIESDGSKENEKNSPRIEEGLNYKEVILNKKESNSQTEGRVSFLKPLSIPRYEGGSLIIELDEDDNNEGI